MKTHILTKQILRAFFGILAIIAPEILDAQTAVGTLNGMLSVSPNGATVYTIPIELPAGRAGMTPQLALTYNSQGEDGILGKGWGISGWSFISRVAETEYYDEKTGAVDFIEDGFSLDGNRLILVEQSTHHEFRTEVDEISRIIRHNPPAKNSADYSYFTVQSRDGFTKTYGQNPGSKQTYGTNNPAIRYHLDKITDLAGNYINYEYEKDQANGELYPKKITYALHPNASSQQLYTVEFVYENMPNQNYFLTSYFANNTAAYRYDVRRHLEKIVVKYMDTFKMQYIIGYETGGIFSKKYLKSITLRSGAEQYNPNYFYWLYNSEVKASTVYFENLVNWNCQESIITGDFNGDGFTDFAEGVSCGINKTYVKLNKEGGCYIFKSINYKGSMKNGDFDGDGCDELLITNALNTRLYKLVNGTMMDIGPTQNLTVKYVADFTGDGLADMITKEGSNYFFYAGNPHLGSFFDGNNKKMLYYFNGSLSYLTGNFAGNGKTGLLYLSGITVTHSLIEQNQEGSYRVEQTFTFNHGINIGSIDVGDFNGDGKDDLLVSEIINTNTRNTRIFYCYGEGFENVNLGILSDQWWKYPYLINDFNNDGIADIAFHTTSDANPSYLKINYVKLFKFPGVQGGFKRYATFINQYHELGCSYNYSHLISYLTGDFNGNGEKDICYSLFFNCDVPPKNTIDEAENSLYGKRKVFYQVNSLSTPDDIIYYIADGFGVGQQITYSPYRPAIYNPVTYPVMIYNKPFSVVSKVVTIKPDGFDYPATTYSYKGLQLHAQGKGLLGFQETTVTNHLNNTVATAQKSLLIENGNYYFPYDANIIVRERETNKLLSETVTTMAAKNTYTSKPKVFVPVATLSYTKKWDNDASNSYMGIKVLKQDLADIDNFGNSTKSITLADEWKWTPDETGWGWTAEHLAGYYAPTQQKWLVNPIYTSTKSRNVEGGNVELTSRSDYTYFGNGFLQKTKTTPNNSGIYATETEYSYDALGNIISTTLRALVDTGIPARTTTFEYNAAYEGRFLTKKTVAAPGSSFVTQYAYDAVKALIISETDIRGHSSYYQYDAFGKPTRTLYPDGTSHNLSLQWSTGMADSPTEALFAAVSFKGLNGSSDKWSETIVFYDKYQRVLRTVSTNLQGQKVYVDQKYDADGRLSLVYEPFYSNNNPSLYTFYAYDVLGRVASVLQPDGTWITNTYTGRTTRTNKMVEYTNLWSEKVVNIMGLTDLAKDPAGTINYDYDAASR
ncbi:MAG: SpvB/TcaC N-terminal domain-containing protein, partial [Bacteroidales bacterium]|nr:SpvB/TcaC N-terminal domain-containing protein [Bacteroidales bacterium]